MNNQKDEDSPRLESVTMRVPFDNEYLTSRKFCKMLKTGVAGIFGPTSPTSAAHIQSICDEKEIPHIQSIWHSDSTFPGLNLYPDVDVLGEAVIDIVKLYDWHSFTILYETGMTYKCIQ